MNKSELTELISQRAGISKAAAGRALDATVAAVTEALKRGDTVTLVGFGSFYIGERAARTGRNPRTGKDIKIEAERRCCADNSIVTYANATFYPKQGADVTTGTGTTAQTLYNPLPKCGGCCNG